MLVIKPKTSSKCSATELYHQPPPQFFCWLGLLLVNFEWQINLSSEPKAVICQPHQPDEALSKTDSFRQTDSGLELLILKVAQQARAVYGQQLNKKEIFRLVLLRAGLSHRAGGNTQSFHSKRSKEAFCTRKPNSKSSFPGIKPQCPILAWENKTGDSVDSN